MIINSAMPPSFSSRPIPFTQWQLLLRRAFRYLPWKRQDVGSVRDHAAPIIDLFASIVMRDERVSETDVDAALDFLRYSFPEAEHAWLARHFQRATVSIHPVSQLAVIAGTNRTLQERMAMALEVLALLKNARDERAIESLFGEVTVGLMLPGAASLLRATLDDPLSQPPEPIQSVRFCSDENAEVMLSQAEEGTAFRALQCGELLLIINDGEKSLRIRGRSLPPQSLIPISPGQVITLENSSVSYDELNFFLNAKKTGTRLIFYLFLEESSLVVQRARLRTSLLRITFGLKAEVELLKKATVELNDIALMTGVPVLANYHDKLVINGHGPFLLERLQRRTEDIGKRFYVDPGQRTVKVSNDPGKIGSGDLLLTSGLSANVLFEVTFSHSAKSGLLIPLESVDPLTVNDRVVRGPMPLMDGDLIRISDNQSLRCRFEVGVLDEERNVLHELQVEGLTHEFAGGIRVLDNIDFSVQRGEMVCILGPSGSGKSTLLSCMAGHLRPTRGAVKYNGLRLYTWQSKLTPLIAHIPREDVLNPYQTVQEHLSQATTIRKPRLTGKERKRRVYYLLKYLGLNHLANRRVGANTDKHLSDGERTRLNLGLDMAGSADVFLIDEPISGLSSRDSENVIETLENISREKIVIVTLHRPSPHLLNRFNKVILLDHGGQLAFWGTPAHMLRYFRKAAEDLGIAVTLDNASAGGADYVFEVMEAPLLWHGRGAQHAGLWQERYENYKFRESIGKNVPHSVGAMTRATESSTIPNRTPRGFMENWRIFRVWVKRTFATRLRSKTNLYTALLEAPIMAFLIAFPLRATGTSEYMFSSSLHISSYLFLSAIAAMFFGLIGSATEIIRDKPLLRRERNARINFTGYFTAKAFVLTTITTVQCALYLMVGNAILEIHNLFLPFLLTLVLTSFVGISVALLISLLIKTERAALNMVPLILVPQILLAGAVVPFEEMNLFFHSSSRYEENSEKLKPGRVPYIAELCPLRYAYETMLVLQATNNPYDANRKIIQREVDSLRIKADELDKTQISKMKLLLQSLTAIASLEAANAQEAEYLLRRVREAVMRNDPEAFLSLVDKYMALEGEKTKPLSSYFVNERVGGQFDYAEAIRMNRELHDRPEIYLSANKPIPFTRNNTDKEDPSYTANKNTVPTPLYNDLHLLLMSLFALLASRSILKRQMERH